MFGTASTLPDQNHRVKTAAQMLQTQVHLFEAVREHRFANSGNSVLTFYGASIETSQAACVDLLARHTRRLRAAWRPSSSQRNSDGGDVTFRIGCARGA